MSTSPYKQLSWDLKGWCTVKKLDTQTAVIEASLVGEAVKIRQGQRSIKADQSVSHRERWQLCKLGSDSHSVLTCSQDLMLAFRGHAHIVFLFSYVSSCQVYVCSLLEHLVYVCCRKHAVRYLPLVVFALMLGLATWWFPVMCWEPLLCRYSPPEENNSLSVHSHVAHQRSARPFALSLSLCLLPLSQAEADKIIKIIMKNNSRNVCQLAKTVNKKVIWVIWSNGPINKNRTHIKDYLKTVQATYMNRWATREQGVKLHQSLWH